MSDKVHLVCCGCSYVTKGTFNRDATIGMTCPECRGHRWENQEGNPYLTVEGLRERLSKPCADCTKGHETWRSANWSDCPRCDCRKLNAGDYLRDGGDEIDV